MRIVKGFTKIKKSYQPSKVDPVFPPRGGRSSFISGPCIAAWDLAAYPPASGGPPSIAGIRGISACKVYPPRQLLDGDVGSYPTFSTSPPGVRKISFRTSEGSYFLWHYLLSRSEPGHPALNRCIALRCPDFPPPSCDGSDDPVGSPAKIIIYILTARRTRPRRSKSERG